MPADYRNCIEIFARLFAMKARFTVIDDRWIVDMDLPVSLRTLESQSYRRSPLSYFDIFCRG